MRANGIAMNAEYNFLAWGNTTGKLFKYV